MELRPEVLATIALLCAYLAVFNGFIDSVDSLTIYRQALALAYTHSVHFHPAIAYGPQQIATSKYGIGLSLFYLPGLAAFAWLRGTIPWGPTSDFGAYLVDPVYMLAAAPVNVIATVLAAFLVARTLTHLGTSRRVALLGLVIYGVGSPALVYSRTGYSQPLEALCWIAAFYWALRARRSAGWGVTAGLAAALGLAFLVRPVEAALLVIFVAPVLIVGRRVEWRVLGISAAAIAGAILLTLLINRLRFGDFLRFGYEGEPAWTGPISTGLAGATVSPARGILWEMPALVLVPLGLAWLRRTGNMSWAAGAAGLVIAQLVNVATWYIWWGGTNWGLRLFVPAIPLIAVLGAAGLEQLPRRARPALAGLVVVGALAWAIPALLIGEFSFRYGATRADATTSFDWSLFNDSAGWAHIGRLIGAGPRDNDSPEILWLRYASSSGNLTLLPPLLLIAAGLTAGRAAAVSLRKDEDSDPPTSPLPRS